MFTVVQLAVVGKVVVVVVVVELVIVKTVTYSLVHLV